MAAWPASRCSARFPRLIKQQYLDKTHAYFERYGGKTVIIARFVPIVRTVAPFAAGVGQMSHLRYQFYNVTGSVLWVLLLVPAGYFFANVPIVKENFSAVDHRHHHPVRAPRHRGVRAGADPGGAVDWCTDHPGALLMRSRLEILGVLLATLLVAPAAPSPAGRGDTAPREGLEDAHLRVLRQVGQAHGGRRVPGRGHGCRQRGSDQEGQRLPLNLASCHTALVGGYVVEGHVPASDVRRLLREKPAILGLAAPGMPPGSPGMDVPGSPPYDVLSVARTGPRRSTRPTSQN